MQNAIEIKKLCKSYNKFNLNDISITLPKGYIMGLIGANGAGKSTTINAILDLINIDSGEIFINGKKHNQLTNAEKEDIGVVLDESHFAETLNIVQIDKIMSQIYKNWDKQKYTMLCKKFNLDNKKLLKDYSKGMKMKLSIAVALSHNAKLLILDEATSGLDPIVRDEILDMLLEFVQKEENSVLLSSHIISDLEKICDYVTFIDNGKVAFSLDKELIYEEYGLLHLSKEHFKELDTKAIIGYRENTFGVDVLVYKNKIPHNFTCEKASLEDIMLYHVKGGN